MTAPAIDRRLMLSTMAALPILPELLAANTAKAQPAAVVLPSWNDSPSKRAIIDFVHRTTAPGSPDFVPPEDRIATFDQDGTLWVEHPLCSQAMFALERVHALAPQHPEWRSQEPFEAVLSNDRTIVAPKTA